MKRIIALLLTVAMCLSLYACGAATHKPTEEGKEKVYEMSIAHLDPSGPIYDGWEYLKKILEEKTNGQIKVTIYPNKSISSSDSENAEKVQQNTIQMSSVPSSALTGLATINGFKVLDYPYMFSNVEELNKVLDSDVFSKLSKELNEKTGIKTYGGFSIGWQRISNKRGPAISPSDLKGLKIRVMTSDLLMATVNAFGASATPLNFGEVFTGLQQGAIEGVMTTSTLHVTERYYEVEKYITCTDAVPNVHIPIVNGEWYDSLPTEIQTTFDECVAEYMGVVRELEDTAQEQSLDTLEKNGMTVTVLTDEQKKAWVDATAGIIDEYKDQAGADIVDSVLEILGKN